MLCSALSAEAYMIRFSRLISIAFIGISTLSVAASTLAQQYPESAYREMRWRMIGPFRGGRTRALAGVAGQPTVFYIGAVNGGVWKSNDAGKTWAHLGLRGGQQIPSLAIDPRDPNRLFAAVLGHPYGSSEERGVFLSTDGG